MRALSLVGITTASLPGCGEEVPDYILPPDSVTTVEARSPSNQPWELICWNTKGEIIATVPNNGLSRVSDPVFNKSDKEIPINCRSFSQQGRHGHIPADFVYYTEKKPYSQQ